MNKKFISFSFIGMLIVGIAYAEDVPTVDAKNQELPKQQQQEQSLDQVAVSLQSPVVVHEVVPGDTLGKIAKQYGTTVDLIKRKNQLKSDVIRVSQRLTIWIGAFDVLIDKSDNVLTVKNGEQVVKTYPISTGRDNLTPEGQFTITTKMENPVWYHKGEIVPPGTPDNFLGTRWLGFDLPQYGIHGTVEPQLIGQSVSHGCVRMHNEDVEELFTYIPYGTKVKIVQ